MNVNIYKTKTTRAQQVREVYRPLIRISNYSSKPQSKFLRN